jgi:hypothetical protein
VSNRAGSGYGKEFMIYTPAGAAFIGDQLRPSGVSIRAAKANAALAAAAPDLLDAIKPALMMVEKIRAAFGDVYVDNDGSQIDVRAIAEAIVAAVAKAEGRAE